jgi:hypothetical protein
MKRNLKVFGIALLVVIIAGASFAFAAANTIADSNAGYKSVDVPGYAVTSIVYDLNSLTPTNVDNIIFHLAPKPGQSTVEAALVEIQTTANGVWTTCGLESEETYQLVTCDFSEDALALDAVDKLNIIASSSLDPEP